MTNVYINPCHFNQKYDFLALSEKHCGPRRTSDVARPARTSARGKKSVAATPRSVTWHPPCRRKNISCFTAPVSSLTRDWGGGGVGWGEVGEGRGGREFSPVRGERRGRKKKRRGRGRERRRSVGPRWLNQGRECIKLRITTNRTLTAHAHYNGTPR